MVDLRRTRLTQAISAARAGRRAEAYQILQGIVADDPTYTDAWLWLGGVASEPAERRGALEQALALDPANQRAHQGIAWLRNRYPLLFGESQLSELAGENVVSPQAQPLTIEEAEQDTPTALVAPATVQIAAAAAGEDTVQEFSAPIKVAALEEPVTQPTVTLPAVEEPAAVRAKTAKMATVTVPTNQEATSHVSGDEELRCPFCGEWAEAADTRCPRCQESLIVAADRTRGARLARVLLAVLWSLLALLSIAGCVWIIAETQGLQPGVSGIGEALAQWGLPRAQVTEAAILQALLWAGLSLGVIALLALVIAVGLFRRWRSIYVLHLVLMLVVLAGTVPLLAGYGLLAGVPASLLMPIGLQASAGALLGWSLLCLVLALLSWREFFPRRGRARIPVQLLTGSEHFRLGLHYRDHGWRWAAVRELEWAVEQDPNTLGYRRVLSELYASMGDHARARDELRASLNLNPSTSPAARAGALIGVRERERK
jgi:hypothetical protein